MSSAHPSLLPPVRRRPASRRRPRRRLDPAAVLVPEMRRLRREVIATALARGRAVRPDTVTSVLAAKQALPEPVEEWTAETVQDLLWLGVVAWCRRQELELPLDVPEVLWVVAETVAAQRGDRQLARTLQAPLTAAGGVDARGRRVTRRPRRTPATRSSSP